jgi:hypothetical protein
MIITLTNPGTTPVFVAGPNLPIPAGESRSYTRSPSQFNADATVKVMIAAGTVTAAYTLEAVDGVLSPAACIAPSYATTAIPPFASVPAGTIVFDVTVSKCKYNDGTAWVAFP